MSDYEISLTCTYYPDEKLLVVIRDTHVIREIPCPDRKSAIAYSSLISDFYKLGYDRCVFEIHKVNEIFNRYGMSAIKTKKDK